MSFLTRWLEYLMGGVFSDHREDWLKEIEARRVRTREEVVA